MNVQMVAVLIQEGSRLFSQWLQIRPPQKKSVLEPLIKVSQEISEEKTVLESKATEVPTGCIPCAIGHMGTCSGLLNEAVRFARADGIASVEVIDRANMCLDELNAMERIDLRPEMIANLPEWEKELANSALIESRNLRHELEKLSNVAQLEQVAAGTQSTRQQIGRSWFQAKLSHMSPEEKAEIQKKAKERIDQIITPEKK